MTRPISVFWRVFVVNAGLLGVLAALLLFSPVEIHASDQADAGADRRSAGLVVTLAANVLLLRRALAPLERLAQRMETVDLLRPGQRLQVLRNDEISRVVIAFNRMLDRLESERQQSGRRVLAAQEAERVGIARDLHDEVGQVLTGVLLHLDSIADDAPAHRDEIDEAKQSVRRALDEVRRISSELRPEMLEQLGLVSALTELTTTFGRVVRHPRRAPVRPVAAQARAGRRARRLPDRAGEPDQRRPPRARQSSRRRARAAASTASSCASSTTAAASPASPRSMAACAACVSALLLIGGALAIKHGPSGGVEVRLEVPTSPAVRAGRRCR